MLPPVSWSADEMSAVTSHGDGAGLTQINDLAKQSCVDVGCGKDDDMDGGWMGAVASMVQCYYTLYRHNITWRLWRSCF